MEPDSPPTGERTACVQMWLNPHLVPVQKGEKGILHRYRYFRGFFSHLNMGVSLLGALKKSVRLTGSMQSSAGFWYGSVAGKLNLSL